MFTINSNHLNCKILGNFGWGENHFEWDGRPLATLYSTPMHMQVCQFKMLSSLASTYNYNTSNINLR